MRLALRSLLFLLTASAIACGGSGSSTSSTPSASTTPASSAPPFELQEMTIADLQQAMTSGRMTSRHITDLYLARIDAIDKKGPALASVIEINPDAREQA